MTAEDFDAWVAKAKASGEGLDAAAYEALGFRLTPRARHPDNMGTSNRLAQFPARNFIELLELRFAKVP